jgi:hypothetical protein
MFALVCAGLIAAAPRDSAVIVDSGSTNTLGYKIEVWSDGTAVITPQNRLGTAQAAPKSFTVPAATASRFFADLRAARKGNATGEPCVKSASFGTTTHVTWHGWTSPDLDCPPNNALTAALVHDVGTLTQASGANTTPMRHAPWASHIPLVISPSPSPSPAPS